MWHLDRTLGSVALAAALLGACTTTPPDPSAPAEHPGDPADATFREVRILEASGPPPQDPKATPAAGRDALEDPDDPAIRAAALADELALEQRRRVELETAAARAQVRIRDLEARVLSLTLERSMLEQEVLRLRIDAIRAELGELGEPVPAPAAVALDPVGPPAPGADR